MGKQEFSIPTLAVRLQTEADAYRMLEDLRWNGRPICPHCGSVAAHYFLTPKDGLTRKTRTGTSSQRRVWKCKDCRKQFSVLTGTIFHGSKISVRTWIFVVFELCASKNGVAAREIERKYNLTGKTAWFMLHRIREAMKREPLAGLLAGTVVADETWIGGTPSNRHGYVPGEHQTTTKTPVLSLVNYETREVRSRSVPNVSGNVLRQAIAVEVDGTRTILHTDGAKPYTVSRRTCSATRRSITRPVSTSATASARTSLRATSRNSNGPWMAPITTSASST